MHERMMWLGSLLVGRMVEVSTTSGVVYVGLLHAVNSGSDGLSVALKMAREKKEESFQDVHILPTEDLLVGATEFTGLVAVDVRCSHDHASAREQRGFMTDGAISGQTRVQGRDLVAWAPPVGDDGEALEAPTFGGLEDSGRGGGGRGGGGRGRGGGAWNQFAANKELFGVETSFDEEVYTTKLDRSSQAYQERSARAERIARDIMKQRTNNMHLAEERGHAIQADYDEEDRYSGVLREEKKPVSLEDAPGAIAQMLKDAQARPAQATPIGEMEKNAKSAEAGQQDKLAGGAAAAEAAENKKSHGMRADAEDFNPFEFGDVVDSLPTSHTPVLQRSPAHYGGDMVQSPAGQMAYYPPPQFTAAPMYPPPHMAPSIYAPPGTPGNYPAGSPYRSPPSPAGYPLPHGAAPMNGIQPRQ